MKVLYSVLFVLVSRARCLSISLIARLSKFYSLWQLLRRHLCNALVKPYKPVIKVLQCSEFCGYCRLSVFALVFIKDDLVCSTRREVQWLSMFRCGKTYIWREEEVSYFALIALSWLSISSQNESSLTLRDPFAATNFLYSLRLICNIRAAVTFAFDDPTHAFAKVAISFFSSKPLVICTIFQSSCRPVVRALPITSSTNSRRPISWGAGRSETFNWRMIFLGLLTGNSVDR